MIRTLMLVPTGLGVGLTTAALGLFHAMDQQGIKVHFFKPIAQLHPGDSGPERSTQMLASSCKHPIAPPLEIRYIEGLLSEDRGDELLEEIVGRFEDYRPDDCDVVIIEGLVPTQSHYYSTRLNKAIASALDAEIVLVAAPGIDTPAELEDHIEITARAYGGIEHKRVLGCIVNKLGAPIDREGRTRPDASMDRTFTQSISAEQVREQSTLFSNDFRLLGTLPWTPGLSAPRALDIARYFDATIINEGAMVVRRVTRIAMMARSVANVIDELRPGTLVFAPGDRDDVVLATCLAALNGVEIAALVFTGGFTPAPSVMSLCEQAMRSGLPMMAISTGSWQTAITMQRFNQEVPLDDAERINKVKEEGALHIDHQWLQSFRSSDYVRRLSPPAFRYQLIERARRASKTIVLPEGNEPRTIKAAAICAERKIARCVLLGNPEEIRLIAQQSGVVLGEGVEVVDPNSVRRDYVAPMVELRKSKGMTDLIAEEQLQDHVVLGTMMLHQGTVDGLVSGAVHTTANTIRPALQLIKTAPGYSLVSSIFFMCLPDQVLVYGDCAINPDPNAEELAMIAIQSADSARAFGVEPRVAMISYSTLGSGTGADVDKVITATRIARERRPDLLIDGPLQYDAAVMENVAHSKAPGSTVAGKATVFIFPDLNTGNTTYKAVQRSANVISIGPMLQGMRKPVNDLSRGALVEDIVFTIALTAIQATQSG
ncbi:phosphate acetyltransferase [Pokkaliibacter plantistimulans]|uniref:Phosphate acetyltransferase n=1 Tax=Pokkaliibacter plantistimulans TaxID=1635171 RepID=A0ABX5LXK0_9GAMM|nr:phosphate acetyltransferase [Pokkaliibacter plantistimulans]PXF31021.1 phosphate acetyltransferase [Pokkaliibacter plantistimulans]